MISRLALAVAVKSCHGAELTFPSLLQAGSTEHELTAGPVDFPGYGVQTRGFNGGLPGPTFRMSPGDTLKVLLKNGLSAANNVACPDTAGEFCETATTNLHTHGLHVSSKGMSDGLSFNSDDIFAEVQPGGSAQYQFTIPENHMGGTHWYHPHHHHATAVQAGGGLAGVLIVEDPPGYLPEVYSSMPEKIMFMSAHNLVTLQEMAQSSQSTLLEGAVSAATDAGLDTNVFFVNGQAGPTMTLESHKWARLRMVYAAVEQSLSLSVTGDATCQWKLLAKDGIYLSSFPRDLVKIPLYPGARADVAISCTCATYPCTASLGSAPARRLQGGPGGGGAGPGGPGATTATVTLLTFSITESSTTTVADLPVTTLVRPCYLADMQSATPTSSGAIDLNGGDRRVQWNSAGESMTYANVHAGGKAMSDWAALTTYTVGGLYEMVVTGANAHPLHVHVIPFQIQAMPAQSYNDGYFQVGDWHDTLMIGDMGGGGGLTVRQMTDKFTGKMVIHCHILEHEDEGMMGFIQVDGTEGTVYSGQATLDPTCYTGAFTLATGSDATTTTITASTATATTTAMATGSDAASEASAARLSGFAFWAAVAVLAKCSFSA